MQCRQARTGDSEVREAYGRLVSEAYDLFVHAAAQALTVPKVGCEHVGAIGVAYACLCCPGTIRCHTCHLEHLPDNCPVCGRPVMRDLDVTHQIEQSVNPDRDARRQLIVHGEICTACAIDNDWPHIETDQ